MYCLEIVIVFRSLRSHVKIKSNLTTVPTRCQIRNKSPAYRLTKARRVGFRLGYSFRASKACEGRVKVSQSNGLAHGDIEIFAPARGYGSLYPIAY